MANLSSLVHELRERIVASSSTPPNKQHDDALESRFRAVLPNLLHAYVVPSSSAKEREVVAVLKLLSHTAKNFPGVFYHGQASAVVPVIGRILPFFAEPTFRPRQGAILETVGSLLSLLRTGDRDAYRHFFMDAMLLSEDLLYAASIFDERRLGKPKRLLLKSFCESFAIICKHPPLLGDLPAFNQPINAEGILVDLTEKERLLGFATLTVKLLSKCLTEGTLYVEGLLDASCVLAVCKLLCFGDADLHVACFEFARLVGAGKNYGLVPAEKLIQSIASILSEDVKVVSVFRNVAYDSALGTCLQSLHSCCSDDVVRSTAADIIRIFPQSMLKTRSLELKAALCSAYARIANACPPCFWKPECLISMLYSSNPNLHLIDCFRVAISRLGPNVVGKITDKNPTGLSMAEDNGRGISIAGGKRHIEDLEKSEKKRQKKDDSSVPKCQDVFKSVSNITGIGETEYADFMCSSLNLLLESLEPHGDNNCSSQTETSLAAICTLCIVFSEHPHAELSVRVFRKMFKWIYWMSQQERRQRRRTFDCLPTPEQQEHEGRKQRRKQGRKIRNRCCVASGSYFLFCYLLGHCFIYIYLCSFEGLRVRLLVAVCGQLVWVFIARRGAVLGSCLNCVKHFSQLWRVALLSEGAPLCSVILLCYLLFVFRSLSFLLSGRAGKVSVQKQSSFS